MNKLIDRMNLLFHGAANAAFLLIPAEFIGWEDYADVLCLIALSLLALSFVAMLTILGVLKLQAACKSRKLKQEIEGGLSA